MCNCDNTPRQVLRAHTSLRQELADPTNGPRRCVLDVHHRVIHELREDGQRLPHDRLQMPFRRVGDFAFAGSLQDGSQRENRGFAIPPVGILYGEETSLKREFYICVSRLGGG